MYKEIETLVEVKSDPKDLEDFLRREFKFDESVTFKDTYFFDPLRPDFQEQRGNASGSLRIRNRNGETRITVKKDVYSDDGAWLYSDETETTVEDGDKMLKIFEALGLKKYTTLNIVSDFFKKDHFEVALQNVENLGTFIEVEYKGNTDKLSEIEVNNIKKEIEKLLATFPADLTPEIDAGKLKLALIKEGKI